MTTFDDLDQLLIRLPITVVKVNTVLLADEWRCFVRTPIHPMRQAAEMRQFAEMQRLMEMEQIPSGPRPIPTYMPAVPIPPIADAADQAAFEASEEGQEAESGEPSPPDPEMQRMIVWMMRYARIVD